MLHRDSYPLLKLLPKATGASELVPGPESDPDGTSTSVPSHQDAIKVASSIVQKAKSVLESEIQDRSIQPPNQAPFHLPSSLFDLESILDQLLRRESNFVDSLMKVLRNRPEQLTLLASQLPKTLEGLNYEGFQAFPVLKLLAPVSPGELGKINFSLINEDLKEAVEYALNMTDLVGLSGHKIPTSQITISPIRSKILPGQSQDGQIEIRVPLETPPDMYSGLLQTVNLNQLPAMIQLSVLPQV